MGPLNQKLSKSFEQWMNDSTSIYGPTHVLINIIRKRDMGTDHGPTSEMHGPLHFFSPSVSLEKLKKGKKKISKGVICIEG